MQTSVHSTGLSLTRPAAFEPEWSLPTEWFTSRGIIAHPEKFEARAGVRNRRISTIDEEKMAIKAVEALVRESSIDIRKCRGLILASSSLSDRTSWGVPVGDEGGATTDHLYLNWPSVEDAAHRLRSRINAAIPGDMTVGISWGCSAYTKALEVCIEMFNRTKLKPGEFLLLITSNRLSERMDYGDSLAAVFGDYATATRIGRAEDLDPRSSLNLLHARARLIRAEASHFYCREVPTRRFPTKEGGEIIQDGRTIFRMDGRAIAKFAPAVLVEEAVATMDKLQIPKDGISDWMQHQAGRLITEEFKRLLYERGISGRVAVRTDETGNLSSSSIPAQLRQEWTSMTGIIGSPSVGGAIPGRPYMTRGSAFFRRQT